VPPREYVGADAYRNNFRNFFALFRDRAGGRPASAGAAAGDVAQINALEARFAAAFNA